MHIPVHLLTLVNFIYIMRLFPNMCSLPSNLLFLLPFLSYFPQYVQFNHSCISDLEFQTPAEVTFVSKTENSIDISFCASWTFLQLSSFPFNYSTSGYTTTGWWTHPLWHIRKLSKEKYKFSSFWRMWQIASMALKTLFPLPASDFGILNF